MGSMAKKLLEMAMLATVVVRPGISDETVPGRVEEAEAPLVGVAKLGEEEEKLVRRRTGSRGDRRDTESSTVPFTRERRGGSVILIHVCL